MGGGGPPELSERGGVIRGRGESEGPLCCPEKREAEPASLTNGRGPELRAPGGRMGARTPPESENNQKNGRNKDKAGCRATYNSCSIYSPAI